MVSQFNQTKTLKPPQLQPRLLQCLGRMCESNVSATNCWAEKQQIQLWFVSLGFRGLGFMVVVADALKPRFPNPTGLACGPCLMFEICDSACRKCRTSLGLQISQGGDVGALIITYTIVGGVPYQWAPKPYSNYSRPLSYGF